MSKKGRKVAVTEWSEGRMHRLFGRYNRLYWKGKVPRYEILVRSLGGMILGKCYRKKRQILIDVASHDTDREVRHTLLHEMCHAAAKSDGSGHGYPFYRQIEMLLRAGAPVAVGCAEAPRYEWFHDAVPRWFPLARKAMRRFVAAQQKELDRIERLREKQGKPISTEVITKDEILQEFWEAAEQLSWTVALERIGRGHGLLDVGGRPVSRKAGYLLRKAKATYKEARRCFLASRRRNPQIQRNATTAPAPLPGLGHARR